MESIEDDSIRRVATSNVATSAHMEGQTRLTLDVRFEDIQARLDALFEVYSKLLVSAHDWSTKDYFDQKISQRTLKILFFMLSGLGHLPESKILEYDSSDRRFEIKRIRVFLNNIIEILEDVERCRTSNTEEIAKIKSTILEFRNRVPESPKSVNIYQIAPLVSAAVAMLLLGLNLSGPNQNLYINAIVSFGSLGLLLFAVGLVISLGFIFRGYVWYRVMIHLFQVRKKELAVLSELRPVTQKLSDWLYRKN